MQNRNFAARLSVTRRAGARLTFWWGVLAAIGLAGSAQTETGSRTGGAGSAKPIAHFTDIADKAGLTAPVIFGGENTKKYIIETTGTGVAIFDYDNDGWPDIFVVNGTTLEGKFAGAAPTSHLYRNNRDGTFTDVTAKASAWAITTTTASMICTSPITEKTSFIATTAMARSRM